MKTIVGIRPTGKLHIGHYFSVIKPALEEKADVLIARYHSSPPDYKASSYLFRDLYEFGIVATEQIVNPVAYFQLMSVAKIGELERMIQYKSVQDKTIHLLTYPILMAHDLMGYDRVIVGEDQKQHVEYANKLFKRLGWATIEGDYRGGRIMSLSNPSLKMSKSDPKGCLFLNDDFKKKIMGAVTTPEGIKNLVYIAKQFGVDWDMDNNKESKEKLIECLERIFGKKL